MTHYANLPQVEPTELRKWIEEHDYNVSRLARDLDVDRTTVHRYLRGETPIPRSIELALEALAKK